MQSNSTNCKRVKVPALLCDIDGVLTRGRLCLPRSADAVRLLKRPLSELNPAKFSGIDSVVPFILVTNGGGNLEKNHAKLVNGKMGLENQDEMFSGEQVVMNFSPFRPVLEEYKRTGQLVLTEGSLNYLDILQDIGVTRYITFEEYSECFPQLFPFDSSKSQRTAATRSKIAQRLSLDAERDFNKPLQVHGIFIFYDPQKWDDCIQLICDLSTTSDGHIPSPHEYAQQRTGTFSEQCETAVNSKTSASQLPGNTTGGDRQQQNTHLPIYIVSNDNLFVDEMRLPRLGFGCFNKILRHTANLMHNIDLKIQMCGKPERITYEYSMRLARETLPPELEISEFYMIGDNPNSDIKGANGMGIKSILVKTGVWQGEGNCAEQPATYVVQDFWDAVQLILTESGVLTQQEDASSIANQVPTILELQEQLTV